MPQCTYREDMFEPTLEERLKALRLAVKEKGDALIRLRRQCPHTKYRILEKLNLRVCNVCGKATREDK